MAEFPAFPLWTDAYLADTGELTTLEHGAYLLLLIAMWRAGGALPNDDDKLRRCTRLQPRQWIIVRPVLMQFLTIDGDLVVQGRLQDEYMRAIEKSRKASQSARAKYRKTNTPHPANASSGQSESPATISISTNTSSSLRSDEQPTPIEKATPRSVLSAVLDKDHVDAVLDHRQRLRKPLTVRAAEIMAGHLRKIDAPNDAADYMIGKGWLTIEPDWWRNRNTPRGGLVAPRPGIQSVRARIEKEITDGQQGTDGAGSHDRTASGGLPLLSFQRH